MADSISLPVKSFSITSSGDGSSSSFDDVCSICLDPFNNTQDPPIVTNCKHEYHLQCILEWSQRSKECPICWQILALKDPASQELLAAVEHERSLRSRIKVHSTYEDHEVNHDSPYVDTSEFDEHIIRNFAAGASRLRYVNRRRRQRSSGIGPSQFHLSSTEEFLYLGDEPSQVNSEISIPSVFSIDPTPPNAAETIISNTNGSRDNTVEHSDFFRQQPPGSPPSPNSSESLSIPESIKSKFSAVSARYKDSISKGTQDFKKKLLARNTSVKELSREVHREMSAGIAGVARMIERLDITSKRTGVSVPTSTNEGGTSNLMYKGKGVALFNHETTRETINDMSSYPPQVRPKVSLQNRD